MDVLERLFQLSRSHETGLAVSDRYGAISYGAFSDLVARFAGVFAKFGPHPRIFILLGHNRFAYAAMFGSLQAGGFYAPGNLESPPAKLRSVIAQFEPDAVVALLETMADPMLSDLGIPIIDPAKLPAERLNASMPPHDLAYVIFTSGSTGVPKGVMIARESLAHYVEWILESVAPRRDDRWSQHPNIGFDLSVFDIYGALCSGGALFPLDGSMDRLMPGPAIRRNALTIWCSVPSVISLMKQAGHVTRENLSSVRLFNFCGEALLEPQARAIFDAVPDTIIQNTYGPTEATVSCTEVKLSGDSLSRNVKANVAIGTPIRGMGIHLFNDGILDQGEIVITGPQLARGYWRDGEATRRQFRTLEFGDASQRGYFTGDWAERVDGNVYFRSRIDFQIKFRGRRIELDEINHALRACGFENAAATLHDGDLHAFVETSENALDIDEIKKHLAEWLEPYAIPGFIHGRRQLPRNANDKIDLPALVGWLRERQVAESSHNGEREANEC